MTKLSIAIITYKRPQSLQKTLAALAKIMCPKDTELQLLIVDNDADRSAKSVFDSAVFTGEKHYVAQPLLGRGYARNTALDAALDSDYLVFIDDDIIPEVNWLKALYDTALNYQAAMVQGK